MREIKFRHFGAHPYLESPSFVYLDLYNEEGLASRIYEIRRQGGSLEQYIGLKDKNGTDVYEGDILQYQNWDESTYKWAVNSEFITSCGCCTTVHGWDIGDIENSIVIGNIHQNRELLNEQV